MYDVYDYRYAKQMPKTFKQGRALATDTPWQHNQQQQQEQEEETEALEMYDACENTQQISEQTLSVSAEERGDASNVHQSRQVVEGVNKLVAEDEHWMSSEHVDEREGQVQN